LAWIAFSRARRFVWAQLLAVSAALLIVAALALLTESAWANRKFQGVAERAHSFTDFLGSGTYVSEESAMKGDNNRFRSLWWKHVIEETFAENPAFGLGFGHDLARAFLREYNPEIADEFTARSPHSILVSTLGRMGLAGLAVFLGLMATFSLRTWRAMRDPATQRATLGLWACVWTILVSACFGVVLEGPMGAVVFWSLLGILNSADPEENASPAVNDRPANQKNASPRVAPLRTASAADEVATFRSQ
jgi:O-antigen ligase